jgi:hypothetical protein
MYKEKKIQIEAKPMFGGEKILLYTEPNGLTATLVGLTATQVG